MRAHHDCARLAALLTAFLASAGPQTATLQLGLMHILPSASFRLKLSMQTKHLQWLMLDWLQVLWEFQASLVRLERRRHGAGRAACDYL
jgi:hypothetical protein